MKRFHISVNGQSYDVTVEEVGAGAPAPAATPAPAAAPAAVPAPAAAPVPAAPAEGTQVKSPMPGTIVSVDVNVGDSVNEGQTLIILEAMKMENEIVAPHAGKVAAISVKKGDSVNSDDLLITLQ